MKFEIRSKRMDGTPVAWTFDNMTNRIFDSNGDRFLPWKHKNFEGITEHDRGKKATVFSPENPLEKSNRIMVLKIQLGLNCNYHCKYCSQASYRTNKHKVPSHEEIDRFFEMLDKADIRFVNDGDIELWGGEPLVYWKALEYMIPILRKRYPKARMGMVTNGSLLTKEKVDFLVENKCSITISHDAQGFSLRDDRNPLDDPEMKEVWLYALRRFKEAEMTFGFNVVITPANCDVFEIRKYFKEKFSPDAEFGFEGVVNYHSEENKVYMFDSDRKKTFQNSIFKAMTEEWDDESWGSLKNRVVQMLEYLVYGVPSRYISARCSSPSERNLVVNVDGTVVCCQNNNPEDFAIGHLNDFDKVSLDCMLHWSLRPNCPKCPFLTGCRGGCPVLNSAEYSKNCRNEALINSAIFAAAWFHMTDTVIDSITPIKE